MGGNVFKDPVTGESLTKRIDRIDVAATLKTLEILTKLDLQNNTLGTTGISDTSGDLDVAVDVNVMTKPQLVTLLTNWINYKYPNTPVKSWIVKTGISVHFRAAIRGMDDLGFVQVDFMFGDPNWLKWALRGETTQGFRGNHRHILMSNIAKSRGFRWSPTNGVMTRDTGIILTTNPEVVASYLLDKDATIKDLDNIDSIMHYIMKRTGWEKSVAEADETMSHDGISLIERYKVDRP